jgi:Fe2+ transport system protein FeoA
MKHATQSQAHAHARVPLASLAPGRMATLAEVDAVDTAQREQLAAYGLVAGCRLKVLQQKPMTLILAEELELALEPGVAREVWVEAQGG